MSSSVTLAPASPSCWERIFCCCRTKPAKQKDDDDDEIDFGQTGETLSELSQAFEKLNKKRTLKLRKIERIKKEQIDPLALQVQKITADLLKVQTKIQEKMNLSQYPQSQTNLSALRYRQPFSQSGQSSYQPFRSLAASQPVSQAPRDPITEQFLAIKHPSQDKNIINARWIAKGDFANRALVRIIFSNYSFLSGLNDQDEILRKLNSLPVEVRNEADMNTVATMIMEALQAQAQQLAQQQAAAQHSHQP